MTEETKWCPRCRADRPISEFYRNKGRSDGLSPLCVECARTAGTVSRTKKRLETIAAMGGRCQNPECAVPGGMTDVRALQIDHVNGDGAVERLSTRGLASFYAEVLAHPDRYSLLCANCNQIKKHERQEFVGKRIYERTPPTEKLRGIGRGNAPAQRAATDNWHATATDEQKAERKAKIAASRKGSKLVDGHWVRPEAPAAS